ncbi:MAG: hypothetical protein ABSC61_09875 [Anaerolineales bacterium]
MNIYVVVEGLAESMVYPCWITLANNRLIRVWDLQEVKKDNFYIVSGMGYPQYFKKIAAAIQDVNEWPAFDRLVIAVDSEEMTREDKVIEINGIIVKKPCRVDIKIIIQHFCLEAWALGNIRIVREHSEDEIVRRYKAIYDVRKRDPEQLPGIPEEGNTRAQFALKYLVAAVREHRYNLAPYQKRNPRILMHQTYYTQLRSRLETTGHISSFSSFMDAFE